MEIENKPLEWQSLEYVEKKRPTDWYFAVSIITLALVATSLIFKNVMLATILFLGSIIVLAYARKKPNKINFSINDKGITIDSNHYIYQNLKSFWIKSESQDFNKLLVKNDSLTNSILSIPLPHEYTDLAKEILNKNIKEEPIIESALDSFLNRLGF